MKPIFYIILLLLSSNLFSYTPGKWSYTDLIILLPENSNNNPIREEVYSSSNILLLTSLLKYKDGLLVQQDYTSNNRAEGYIKYEYNSLKKIVQETTFDDGNKTKELKQFVYNSKNNLSKIKTFDESKKVIQEATIVSMDKEFIEKGEVNWIETKDKEKYSLVKRKDSKILSITDEKSNPIAKIEFKLNAKGFISERIFLQGNIERKNVLEYDSKDRLSQFTFHVKQDGKWNLIKTHKLFYE